MIAHAACPVGLNRGFDAGRFESAFGQVSFNLRCEAVNDYKFAVIHAVIIRQSEIAGEGRPQRRGEAPFVPQDKLKRAPTKSLSTGSKLSHFAKARGVEV